MVSRFTALPILVLLFSVSTMSLVRADSEDDSTTSSAQTTQSLHVDMGNGNFFDLPYSISGATVTGVKVDTSIPKMIISVSSTQDGQITLQVPGGDRYSTENDFTVLVDGQNTQYTQSDENGHKMVTIPFRANSSTIELIGQHETSQYSQNFQYNQTGTSCTQDDIQNAKDGIASLKEKMNALRTQFYNDWKTAYNSGQYNGTWEQYSHDKLMSSLDIAQLKSDYEKYNSVLRSCDVNHMYPPSYPASTTCSQDDINHARGELVTTEKEGYELKDKIYGEFQQSHDSGQFNGTWNQYAQENFWNLPEVSQLKITHEKYSSFLRDCFGEDTMMPPTIPQNQEQNSNSEENTTATLPSTQSQDIPSINPSDAQAIVAGHGIPSWVKQIVGWWVEGKISDSDFVTVVKFLIHQGIIKP